MASPPIVQWAKEPACNWLNHELVCPQVVSVLKLSSVQLPYSLW